MNTLITVIQLAFIFVKLSDANLVDLFRHPQCLMHLIHIVNLNDLIAELFSEVQNSPVIVQSLKKDESESLNDKDIRKIFLRAANVKRSYTQSCYIQFYDVDSLLNEATGSNANLHISSFSNVLRQSVLPNNNWADRDLRVSPNFCFLLFRVKT